MIVAENVHRTLNGTEVLKGVSLEVEEGEMAALIGGSGEGKTVFLKHLAGLMHPDDGRVLVNGKDLCCLGRRKLKKLREGFGFLFQDGALFQSMTVYENIAFPLREKTDLSESDIRDRVTEELRQVGLEGNEEKYPAELSGGMAKRVALARALAQDPELMLFDEPTTGLDPTMGHAIRELIGSIHERFGLTGVLATHEIPHIFRIVDTVAMLEGGRIRFRGTPEDIMESEDPAVRRFLENSMPPRKYRLAGGVGTHGSQRREDQT